NESLWGRRRRPAWRSQPGARGSSPKRSRATVHAVRPRLRDGRAGPEREVRQMDDGSISLEGLRGPELEYFLLARLQRVAGRLADWRAEGIPAWQALARHATGVAYRDCLAFGLADEAAVILREARDEARRSG